MTRSLPDPRLLIFDPEIERTISRIRREQRRLVRSEGGSESEPEEETNPRSTDSVVLRAENMAARRITIQEEGAPDFTLQPFQAHHPAAACSTVRRNGADETSILLKVFPFSLEGKAREGYYTQPLANDDNETLFEYWKRFNNLLEACPHHMIDKIVLLSYVTQGMRPQDKTTLESASNGSMKKYKTTDEAWQLISNLAESTRNHRQKQGRSRAVAEVSSGIETAALNRSICEMTNLLKQMQLNQQAQQTQPQQNQQLVPQRICGICADYSHYTDECPQLQQEDNMDNSNQNWRDNNNRGGRDNQGNQRWNNYNNRQQNQPYRAPHLRQTQGPPNNQQQTSQFTHSSVSSNEELLQDFEKRPLAMENTIVNSINASLNGFTSTLQACMTQLGSETNQEEPSSPEYASAEEVVEIEDVEEEEDIQDIVEEEIAQPQEEAQKGAGTAENTTLIPFPQLERKLRKQLEPDPKMVEIFKKVEASAGESQEREY
ncbi:uncharacterized protein LOC107493593 [Arachis duranensis]|uniref:Uncharacterized protein LOC107493593 n=1 Tax=Arachis duranensis TaxID=130453 RepID=A0A6P4DL75_ARADU|nr:uncharacterized protein LOC107493593 [Arachis duranensis]